MNEDQKQLLDNWEKCITVNLDNILWGIVSDLLKAQEAKTREEERKRAVEIIDQFKEDPIIFSEDFETVKQQILSDNN